MGIIRVEVSQPSCFLRAGTLPPHEHPARVVSSEARGSSETRPRAGPRY